MTVDRTQSELHFTLSLAVATMNTPQEIPPAAAETRKQGPLPAEPSYGALVWAAVLALCVFSDSHVFPIQIMCFALSLAACIWWFVVSLTRQRRSLARRVLGYAAFGFGSTAPLSSQSLFPLSVFTFYLAIAAVFLTAAFYLVFKRHKSAAQSARRSKPRESLEVVGGSLGKAARD